MTHLHELAALVASTETRTPLSLSSLINTLVQPGRAFITKEELRRIAHAKGTRFGRHKLVDENCELDVRAISKLAFALDDDVLRIKILCVLRGVNIPVASAILAWCFPEKFPVIDQRAWRTLRRAGLVIGKDTGVNLGIRDWGEYLSVVREISNLNGMSPQAIDSALYWLDKTHPETRYIDEARRHPGTHS